MAQKPTTLYIIDDEPSVCKAFARLARSALIEARTFSSVEEFLAAETKDDNACIICDIAMPGISGLELPALLQHAGRDIPVIFITAHDNEETRALAQKAGPAGFFKKPVDDQALLDAVAWAIARKAHTNGKT